jgi:hypothetical protein
MNPRMYVLVKKILFISALIITVPLGNTVTFLPVGEISQDTTWQKDILITETVVVQPGVTLTILPGTTVKFQHYRGYRNPEKRLSLLIQGTIIAEGTPDQPIYFTSDAPDPQNGDWSMVRLESVAHAQMSYCVFEFGQQGLNVWQGSPTIDHCVFRWNNWEGVYFESFCQPVLTYCHIYENGYNGLAAEQSNSISMDYCDVWRNGTNGVHIDNSVGEIVRSRIHDNGASGLSVDDGGTLRALGVVIYGNYGCGIGVGEGENTVEIGNLDVYDNGENMCGQYKRVTSPYSSPGSIDINFSPEQSYALGYIPGDQEEDQYAYVYPDDETRRIIRKIGEGLGLTWSVAWDGHCIWTCTLWNHVYKLNPETGNILEMFELPDSEWGTPSQPWGMTFDDEGFMWIVDFAERKLFKVDVFTHMVVYSCDTPSPEQGGCKGLAWDGDYLCVMGWTSPTLYQMTKTGNVVNTIQLKGGGGGLAWDGEHFWVPGGGGILKYDGDGNLLGWIYAASEGTWDLTWDGKHLWAAQRTNENWPDAKIYQLELLDDHTNYTQLAVLVIESDPEASVYVNDVYKGDTPLTLELKEGEYEINLQKENYEVYTDSITVSPGEKKDIFIVLQSVTDSVKIAVLVIESDPEASVYVNDVYKGDTPLTLELKEGDYEIHLQKENYKAYISIITVSPGEKKDIFVVLKRELKYIDLCLGLAIIFVLLLAFYYRITRKKKS